MPTPRTSSKLAQRPANEDSPDHSARRKAIVSATRARRSAAPSCSRWNIVISTAKGDGSLAPAPRPRRSRPPDSDCNDAAAVARCAAGRVVTLATSGPSCTRSVTAAMAPSVDHTSRQWSAPSTAPDRWS